MYRKFQISQTSKNDIEMVHSGVVFDVFLVISRFENHVNLNKDH